MSAASRLRYLHLAYFSQPSGDRLVYRMIRRHRPQNIVELGIGLGVRSLRMIQLAADFAHGSIRYAGIDRFESRTDDDGPGLSLKLAHTMLSATAARVRLLPGDPLHVLANVANDLTSTDLLLIASFDRFQNHFGWQFVPRMLHPRSVVLVEQCVPGKGGPVSRWRPLPIEELSLLTGSSGRHRRAA